MTPAIDPNLSPHAFVLKEHKNAVGSLYDFKGLRPDENSRNSGRIAAQNRIVTFRGCFRAVAWLRGVVFGLGPGSHIRRSCAGAAVETLIWNCLNEELIYAGQVVSGIGNGGGGLRVFRRS